MSRKDEELADYHLPPYLEYNKMNRIWRRTKIWIWVAEAVLLATLLFIVINFALYLSDSRGPPRGRITVLDTTAPLAFDVSSVQNHIEHLKSVQEWQKPPDLHVVGLVFFGRRRFVEILNCYLQVCESSLASAGCVLEILAHRAAPNIY